MTLWRLKYKAGKSISANILKELQLFERTVTRLVICFMLDSALWNSRSSSRGPQAMVSQSISCLRRQLDKITQTGTTACCQKKGGLLSTLQALGKRIYSLRAAGISAGPHQKTLWEPEPWWRREQWEGANLHLPAHLPTQTHQCT